MKFVFILACIVICSSYVESRKGKKIKQQKVVPIQTVSTGKKIIKNTKNDGKGDEAKTATVQKATTDIKSESKKTTDTSKVKNTKINKATVQVVDNKKYSKKEQLKKPIVNDGGGRSDKNKEKDTKKNIKTKLLNKADEIKKKIALIRSADDVLRLFDPNGKIKFRKVPVFRPPIISKDVIEETGYVFDSGFSVSKDSRNMVARDGVTQATVFQDYGCEPRPKVLEVPQVVDGAYWPACVQIMQCGGCCGILGRECAPTLAKNVSTPVYKIPYDGSLPFIHNVFMIHHAQCGCRCRITKDDCTPTQTYDEPSCSCTCSRTPTSCPVGQQWSDIECGCVCSMAPERCPKRHYWNKSTCRCECSTDPCPPQHTKDPSTCYCLPQYNLG